MTRWLLIISVLLCTSAAAADTVISMPPPPSASVDSNVALAHFAHQTPACDRAGQAKQWQARSVSHQASAMVVGDGWNGGYDDGWYGSPFGWWGYWPCIPWTVQCVPVTYAGGVPVDLCGSGAAIRWRSSSLSMGWGVAIR